MSADGFSTAWRPDSPPLDIAVIGSGISGLGAAWLWQGAAGQGFDAGAMAGLQRFLSEAQPRLRILGGSRCGGEAPRRLSYPLRQQQQQRRLATREPAAAPRARAWRVPPGASRLPPCRFNPGQAPAPEWAVFGSYLFMLPQLEVAEVDGALLMAVNCAWDCR